MQIATLEPFALTYPLSEPLPPSAVRPQRHELDIFLVRLQLENGSVAWGEAWLKDEENLAAGTDFFANIIGDAHLLDRGLLFRRMMTALSDMATDLSGTQLRDYCAVLSAIDTALWDLAGKHLNVSVARLLGGVRTRRLDTYVTGLYLESFETLRTRALDIVDRGWWAMKMKLGGDLDRDVETVEALREAVGNQVVLLADANGAYEEYEDARELGDVLGKNDFFWFEEPLPAGRWEEYAKLVNTVEPPIAGGETLFGLRQFHEALKHRAMHVVMPDPRLCGGISAAWIVADIARLFDCRVSVHSWVSPLALMAAANVTVALPYATHLEMDTHVPAIAEEMFIEPPAFDCGFLLFEDRPGLGVEVNEDFVKEYSRSPDRPKADDENERELGEES